MTRPPLKRFLTLLALLLVAIGLLVVTRKRAAFTRSHSAVPTGAMDPKVLARFSALEARENLADETFWAKERRAEELGTLFDSLWDELNKATNKLAVLGAFSVGEIIIPKFGAAERVFHGIDFYAPQGQESTWSQQQWQEFLAVSERVGWQLAQTEFRQNSFETNSSGEVVQSRFYFRADVTNPDNSQLATLEGDLTVDWTPYQPGTEQRSKHIDASRVRIRSRRGAAPFNPILADTVQPLENWAFIDPLILYDLDGDGLSEVILAAKNLVYHRRDQDHYEARPLCKYTPGRIHTAVIADFDGDGFADFLCAKSEGLFLFKGSPQRTFDEPGRLVWEAKPPLKYGQFLTCGDIDHDGDLDVFLGQYKSPYYHGQMPTPYYDANDSDPAYLLLNDGHGNFVDATVDSGLAVKRWRRSYSGSFVDLDGDGHLDLVIVSDFAGLEIYRNDGRGHFREVTQHLVSDGMGFGMSHCLADFNCDGRLDLLMIGMGSPTVNRLEHLGLWRSDVTENRAMRARMVFGNRLFLARPDGHFEQTALNDTIAQTGWSWGCSAADFDNDGFADLYVANGHDSRSTVHEYEPEYWLHDIYVAGSTNDLAANTYFQAKFGRTRGAGQSYGGYEKNRFYFNRNGASFFEAGYLMGVALEADCRNVVADDLDGDGRIDLLVTTFEVWPEVKQTLRVYRNGLNDTSNWIGFRFREEGPGKSPVGARVTLQFCGHTVTRRLVTGDSQRSQSANTLHFGLGPCTQVEQAEVTWPNGKKLVLKNPKVNEYHAASAASTP
jgi:hypothetical protein